MSLLKKGNIPDKKFNKVALKKGMAVEMEHTNNPLTAKQIAKAHLFENPNYYTYLSRMEQRHRIHIKRI